MGVLNRSALRGCVTQQSAKGIFAVVLVAAIPDSMMTEVAQSNPLVVKSRLKQRQHNLSKMLADQFNG
jgi:hypothetical protein